MGLLILKNQGYQEYQNSLQQEAGKSPRPAPEESAGEQSHLPAAQEKAARPSRHRYGLLAVFTVIMVLSSATTIVLYQYRTAALSGSPAPVIIVGQDAAQPAAAAEKVWAEQRSLWRCSDGSYTNVPTAGGNCEYVGAAEAQDQQQGGPRFITPSAPKS